MTRSRYSGLKGLAATLLAGLSMGALVACNGPTDIDAPAGVGDFQVALTMDPQTLNPPQIGTISYALTDQRTGKAVNQFTRVFGANFHNILISHDLQHFKHSYSDRVDRDVVSLQTYFPVTALYNSYAIFQPAESDVYVYAHQVTAAVEGDAPTLTDSDASRRRVRSYGLQTELITAPETLHAGQDAQLAFYVTELGQPVTGLWPFLDAPGYLWMVDQEGGQFTWEVGASPSHVLTTTATATSESATEATAVPTQPVPTFFPDLDDLIATRTAQPVSTIPPVQQTAQVSISEPQEVRPQTTYGPYVLFAHRFPDPGFYKMWFEFKYRGQVVITDWVVKVVP